MTPIRGIVFLLTASSISSSVSIFSSVSLASVLGFGSLGGCGVGFCSSFFSGSRGAAGATVGSTLLGVTAST